VIPTPAEVHDYVKAHARIHRQHGDELEIHCPNGRAHSHNDHIASCHVNVSKRVIDCKACDLRGSLDRVWKTVGWPQPSWVRDNGGPNVNDLPSTWKNQVITRWHRYTSEDGTILYWKARVDLIDAEGNPKKEFPFYCQGSWGLKDKKVRRVPYRLHKIKDASEIHIVEGESDVKALERLGFIATTNDGGAGKWTDDHSKFFKQYQRVVVHRDNDKVGADHQIQVLTSLHGKVVSLKAVHLERDIEKGDVRDWVETREQDRIAAGKELSRIIDETPEWTPDAAFAELDEEIQTESVPVPDPIENTEAAVRLEDFYSYSPQHNYIFTPTRDLWPAESVNGRIDLQDPITGKKIRASRWLDRYRTVAQMTWIPGEPMIIYDRVVSEGGWIERPGLICFNRYLPPEIVPGDPTQAKRWLDHVRLIYNSDAGHIVKFLAHRVQRPKEKPNHALVLGGLQGIGKDTLLEPVKYAVGPWNFCEVSPVHLLGRFNGFVKSVILRINEARDLGDVDRFAFYDHLKLYTCAPPDVIRCDEKNVKEYPVFNVCGVVITTNHKSDGIYLPADDRRHYVAWSDRTKEDFEASYWNSLYGWYNDGGNSHVAAYLLSLDISDFDPKAPPPKTEAFWEIVNANRAPENAELADAIEALGNPDAITLEDIIPRAGAFGEWLRDRRNSRQVPHRFEDVGYVPVRNSSVKDQLWKIGGKRLAVYARRDLPLMNRIAAATKLTRSGEQ
jgi:hypothetical protein